MNSGSQNDSDGPNRQIIYAWNYREWGGVQIYFLSLIKEVRRYYHVVVIIPEDSDPLIVDALRKLEVDVRFVPPAPSLVIRSPIVDRIKVRIRVLASEKRLVDLILKLSSGRETIAQPDLGFWQSATAIFLLTRKTNVVITHHTPLKRQKPIRDLIWRFKGRFIARLPRLRFMSENNDGKKSLVRYLGERKASEVLLTYAGFDADEIEAVVTRFPGNASLREKYGLSGAPLLVTVGQFIERKGCWVVLEALRKLVEAGIDFTFLWLSTAAVPADVTARVDAYGLGERFRITAAKEMDDMRFDPLTILLAADIFVLASLEEGLPIALIEAMALGRACLTTNVNAIPEAVENGFSGVLIEPNDPEMLADKMTKLIAHPDQRALLGSNAKAVAYERFNEKTTAELTMKLYDEVWKEGN